MRPELNGEKCQHMRPGLYMLNKYLSGAGLNRGGLYREVAKVRGGESWFRDYWEICLVRNPHTGEPFRTAKEAKAWLNWVMTK